MGDGKNLKKILDEKDITIRKVAIESGIVPTTLYSIISRDSPIRYDYAMRIAKVLEIPEESICSSTPSDKVNSGKMFSLAIEKELASLPKEDIKIIEVLIHSLYQSHENVADAQNE